MKLSTEEKALLEKANRIIAKVRESTSRNVKASSINSPPRKEMITYHEAKLKYKVEPRNRSTSDLILIVHGDVHVHGNLNNEWIVQQVKGIKWEGDYYGGIVIAGDVIVDGDVLDDDHIELHTTKNLTCNYMFSENGAINIQGSLDVQFGIYGEYNDGELNVDGKVLAPYIIASDHQMPRSSNSDFIYVEGGDDSEINYIAIGKDQGASFGWGWNYFKDSAKLFSPEVWHDGYFSTERFFDLVRKGENPFLDIQ